MTEYRIQANSHLLGRLSWIFSSSAAGLGLLALVGWIFEVQRLTSFWPDGIPMAPSSALLFLLFGSGLPLRTSSSKIFRHFRLSILFIWLGTAVSVILFILSLCGIYLPVEYLGMDITGMVKGAPIGHMSPMTAFIFSLTGCSLLLLFSHHRKLDLISFWLAAGIVLCGMILIVGYLVDAPMFYGTAIIPPAMTTSLAFFLLGISLLLAAGLNAWLPLDTVHSDARNEAGIILLLVFSFLVTGILATGFFFSQYQQKQFRSRIEAELNTVADLKIREIKQWRQERLGDGLVFFKNSDFSEMVRHFFDQPSNIEARRHLEFWLEKIAMFPQYNRISLLNAAGVEQFSIPNRAGGTFPENNQDISNAVEARQVILLDFARKSPDTPTYLTVVIPILSAPDWSEVLGVLTIEINPAANPIMAIG